MPAVHDSLPTTGVDGRVPPTDGPAARRHQHRHVGHLLSFISTFYGYFFLPFFWRRLNKHQTIGKPLNELQSILESAISI